MITVTLYTKPGCHLCEQAKADLESLQAMFPHQLVEIDINSDQALSSAFALEIPVVEAGPFRLKAPITRQELQMALGAASDRKAQFERLGDKSYQAAVQRGQKVTGTDRFSYWLSRHYMLVINLFLFLYVGLPFLGPVFMKAGWDVPAEVVYRMYRPLCHQWGFRSFYLFGGQITYPHAAAQIPGLTTFEAATGITDQNDPGRQQARTFEGNPGMGYKIALCERDLAIWGALLLFGLAFSATGRRLPPIHWVIWVIFGILPVGLDGFSQLFSQIPSTFIQSVLPYRESTPFLRVLTGFLFGFMTAWFGIPVIEESMAETRRTLAKKFAIHKS